MEEKYEELFKLVEFCVLMQQGEGILGKAPSYIREKFDGADGSGSSLDYRNQAIFSIWKKKWISKKEQA